MQPSGRSEKPIYQQLFEQISSRILLGEMEPGFALPPIRTAAKELRVSIITVKKTWEELERTGLIDTITGKGCFVAEFSQEERRAKREEIILLQWEKDREFYRNFNVDGDELGRLISEHY